jgi:hypothetical protein
VCQSPKALDQDFEHIGFSYAQRLDVAVGNGIRYRFNDKQSCQGFCAVLPFAGVRLISGGSGNLPASLLKARLMDYGIGCIERTQAGAERPPFAVMFQHHPRQAGAFGRLRRIENRRNGGHLRIDPLSVDFQENRPFVLEVGVKGAGRITRSDRDAIGVGAVETYGIEKTGRSVDQGATTCLRVAGPLCRPPAWRRAGSLFLRLVQIEA